MEKYLSNSVNETEKIAFNIAKSTPIGSVVELIGELGAGKTAFAKGFAKGLGIADTITSPTFALLNSYVGDNGIKLNHFDLYRLEDIEELFLLGFEEILNSKNEISLVEWPQIAESIMPKHKIVITISKLSSTEREIKVEIYEYTLY